MTTGEERPESGSLRIGTWNLDGRSGPRQRDFLASLGCDVLLLTEVPEGLDLGPWSVHLSEAEIREGVRYAAVAARTLAPEPSPHPASAVAEHEGWRFCSSVLPWRSSGGAAPWSGDSQAERTEAACRAIAGSGVDVWGGDWNHAMQGTDWAGSTGGRAAIEDAVARLGLQVVTVGLLAAGDTQASIDHVAVSLASVVERAERVVASDERGRLSDHDAYVVPVHLALGHAAGQTCDAAQHRWRPVVYGLPTPETFEAAEREDVLLGGCVFWGESAHERCADCGIER